VHYFTYAEAVAEHIELMRQLDAVRYGIFDRDLIESALARPQQAAAYDNADLFAQAATLCYGLEKIIQKRAALQTDPGAHAASPASSLRRARRNL
jgi:prophage maintenance system killer protein